MLPSLSILGLLLGPAPPATPVQGSYLCDQYSLRGDTALAAACYSDQIDRQREADQARRDREIDDSLRRREDEMRRTMDNLLLEDRLRERRDR